MAYAYNAIDEMMGSNNGQSANNNIFAPQGSPGNNGANQGADQSGAPSDVKTTTEGDVNNATPTSGSNPSPKNVVSSSGEDSDNRAAQAAYKANAGKTQTPAAFQAVQGQIDSAKTNLAQRASDYAASQAASHNYAVGTDVADQAVKKQDKDAYGKITGLLGQTTAAPVDTFDAGDINVSDADLLNTNAGIKNLVARGQGPKYSPNMAAFDSMLLQSDPNFQKQVSGLKSQASDFTKSSADTATKAQTDAEAAAQANLTNSQKSIKDYLGQSQSGILADEAAAAAKANAALPQTIAAQKAKVAADLLKAQQDRASQALGGSFGAGRADAQLAAIKEDPSKYIDWIKGYDPSQFINQDQASQYNTINSLLGLGGQSQVAAGALPSLYNTRGDDLYNNLVNQATTARQSADKTDKTGIQAILDAANQKAQADNARRLALTTPDAYKKSLSDLATQFSKSQEFSPYSSIYNNDIANQVIGNYSSANPLAAMGGSNNPNLAGMDVLDQNQASQLNSLSRDLGLSTIYNQGQYAAGGPGSLVDNNGFKNALLTALKNYQQNSGPQMDTSVGTGQLAIPQNIQGPSGNIEMRNRPITIAQNEQYQDPLQRY